MRLDRRFSTYLTRLMSRITIECNFQPETALTIEIADRLRRLTLAGRLRAVWFHVPNDGERKRLELRCEAQNAFNHPQFVRVPQRDVVNTLPGRFLNKDVTDSGIRTMWVQVKLIF